jgi:hypothetical protein
LWKDEVSNGRGGTGNTGLIMYPPSDFVFQMLIAYIAFIKATFFE